jgi:threonine dehydratase
VIAEGAGALSTAAATAGLAGTGTIACIVSGGNINLTTFRQVLEESERADTRE